MDAISSVSKVSLTTFHSKTADQPKNLRFLGNFLLQKWSELKRTSKEKECTACQQRQQQPGVVQSVPRTVGCGGAENRGPTGEKLR